MTLASLRSSFRLLAFLPALTISAASLVGAPAALEAQTAHFTGSTSVLGSGFSHPSSVAVDASGNLFVADSNNNAVKEIPYSSGAYGTPVTLGGGFFNPSGVAVDVSGNVYVADTYDNAIKKIPYSSGSYGMPVTVGSGFAFPYGVAVDVNGNVYLADTYNSAVKKIPYSSGSYGTQVTLGSFSSPYGVAVDASGNVYVADTYSNAVRKIPYSSGSYGTPVMLGGGFSNPDGVAVDASGNVYVADTYNDAVKKIPYSSGSYGTPVTLGSGFNTPFAVAVDVSGSVYVADYGNNAVKRISFATNFGSAAVAASTAVTQTLTFSIDTAGTLPALSNANVLTMGVSGLDFTLGTGSTCAGSVTAGQTCTVNVAFTPQYPGVRLGAVNLLNSSGTVLATAYISGTGTGPLASFSPGAISTVAGNGTAGYTASQDTGSTTATAASLKAPTGIALDGAGNLYIADYANNRIRKVTAATGFISTVAGNGTAGYTASQDTGTTAATAASLNSPYGVAVDGAGNLYISDSANNRVRKVAAATGFISTVAGNGTGGYTASQDTGTTAATAASLNDPQGMALDGAGNLYIADYGNSLIRKVTAATGFISTVAGNGTAGYTASQDTGTTAATATSLNQATDVAVDGAGNLYIADFYNYRIRMVAAATGFISTVAGKGTAGYSASQDTGTTAATAASLNNPEGVKVDAAGNLYITDSANNRIRKVTAATGFINTLAGKGTSGYTASQDTGTTAATATPVNYPIGVALDGAGNLYFADYSNNRIRKVTATAAPVAFTNAAVGGTSAMQTVTVNNIGNDVLTLTQPSAGQNPVVPASFALAGGSCLISYSTGTPATLAAGANCTEVLDYKPTFSGGTAGQLTFTDNSLNAVNAVQQVNLGGNTATNLTVAVGSWSVAAGNTAVPLTFIVGYAAAGIPTGTPVVKVNGSATGVSALSCLGKALHTNCSFTYNASALAAGDYTISVTQPADTTYTTAVTGTGTLTITSSGIMPLVKPGPVAVRAPVAAVGGLAAGFAVSVASPAEGEPAPDNVGATACVADVEHGARCVVATK